MNAGLPTAIRKLGNHERGMILDLRAAGHGAPGSPREVARFPCGLSSPATGYARHTSDSRFGALADVPLPRVLFFVEPLNLFGINN